MHRVLFLTHNIFDFDSCHFILTFVLLVEHKVRVDRLSGAEDGAERGQCAREEPGAGGLLLCERFFRWTHLLA